MNFKRHARSFSRHRGRAAALVPLLVAWSCVRALPQEPLPAKPAPAAAAEDAKPAEPEATAWLGIIMEVARNLDADEDEKPLPGVGVMDAGLWVGRLNTAVDASIARYSVLDLPTYDYYLGLTLFNYGLTHRVGRNVMDDYGPLTVNPSTGVVMGYDYDNNDTPSVGGDETFVQGGDSGGPSFTVFDGNLTVLGIHWAITDDFPATNEGESSYDTFVPTYIADLNLVLDDKGQSVSVVPEPAAALFIFIGAAGFAWRHRRRPALQARR